MNNTIYQDKELLEQLQNLTLERLKVMPHDTSLAIGSQQYSKEDLIKHVTESDELGQQVMSIQLEYLQDLASGEIYRDGNTNN